MDKEVFENSIRHLAPCDGAESCVFTVLRIHLSLQHRQMSSAMQHEKAEFRERRGKGEASVRGPHGKQIPSNLHTATDNICPKNRVPYKEKFYTSWFQVTVRASFSMVRSSQIRFSGSSTGCQGRVKARLDLITEIRWLAEESHFLTGGDFSSSF